MIVKLIAHLLLAAGICLQGVALPAPGNVAIKSHNLRSVLHWNCAPSVCKQSLHYTVQYQILGSVDWRDVTGCSPTNDTWCDLSPGVRPYMSVTLRVRVQVGNQSSDWSSSSQFCAYEQTHLGPPNITVSNETPYLLTVHVVRDHLLKEEFGDQLVYRVSYGTEQSTDMFESGSDLIPIRELDVGVSYCVWVRYVLYPEQRVGSAAGPQCSTVRESDKMWITRSALLTVFILLLLTTAITVIIKYYSKLKAELWPIVPKPRPWLSDERSFYVLGSPEESCDTISEIVMEDDEDPMAQRT